METYSYQRQYYKGYNDEIYCWLYNIPDIKTNYLNTV